MVCVEDVACPVRTLSVICNIGATSRRRVLASVLAQGPVHRTRDSRWAMNQEVRELHRAVCVGNSSTARSEALSREEHILVKLPRSVVAGGLVFDAFSGEDQSLQ